MLSCLGLQGFMILRWFGAGFRALLGAGKVPSSRNDQFYEGSKIIVVAGFRRFGKLGLSYVSGLS